MITKCTKEPGLRLSGRKTEGNNSINFFICLFYK